jgi:hypothetical protein
MSVCRAKKVRSAKRFGGLELYKCASAASLGFFRRNLLKKGHRSSRMGYWNESLSLLLLELFSLEYATDFPTGLKNV